MVGIGASAGGLEAFRKLLRQLPADTGMALVFVQHVDGKDEGVGASLLSRATRMPVHEVTNWMPVEPNHVYVISQNTNIRIERSALRFSRRLAPPRRRAPIDDFFQSLALAQQSQAIGVLLSGTAPDGTAGLRAIKANGGVTFAQKLSSAPFQVMPRKAIAAGVVDFALTPEEIARKLQNISRPNAVFNIRERPAELSDQNHPASRNHSEIEKIFGFLRTQTGSDLSAREQSIVELRVRQRMAAQGIESLSDYFSLLQQDPTEARWLGERLPINIHELFRDPETLETLKSVVFPKLLADRPEKAPLRIWVPGCSTGEEVYSIAIALADFMNGLAPGNAQIFATDISDNALVKARIGSYADDLNVKIPPALLERYFTKTEHGFRISKRIREMCIFARQDLTADLPFSRVDLISCRNILPYFGQPLDKQILSIFHYALKADGYLLVGSSDTIETPFLFAPVDEHRKIYIKKASSGRPRPLFPIWTSVFEKPAEIVGERKPAEADLQTEADRIVLEKYNPPGVVINQQLEVVHVRGDMLPYLRRADRVLHSNLLQIVREDIATNLRAALEQARNEVGPVRMRAQRGGFPDANPDLEIHRIQPPAGGGSLFLVLFERAARADDVALTKPARPPGTAASREIKRLEQALAENIQQLQFLMGERAISEEELRAANEEILTSNEELQSTNDQLELSQQELQSANAELSAINDELQLRNAEMAQLSNDLSNMINSVNTPIVMLDYDRRIRYFTPMGGRVFNLTRADIGRPVTDIQPNLDICDLENLLSDVIDNLIPREREVQDRGGAWYVMRIRPYRTAENGIAGAVLVLYDIDRLKGSLEEVRLARDFSQAIVETVPEPLVVLSSELCVVMANRAFYETFHLHRHTTERRPFCELVDSQWKTGALSEKLERAFRKNQSFEPVEMEAELACAGRRVFLAAGRLIDIGANQRQILLLSLADITERRMLETQMQSTLQATESSLRESEADLRRSREELRALAARLLTTQEEERRRVSRELHDDLNQKLAMLEMDAERLGNQLTPTPELARELQSLRNRVADLSNDIRRVAYQLHPSILDHLGLGVALRSYCAEFSRREEIKVRFSVNHPPESVPEESALCLYRVTQEGLRNVARHASAKTVRVELETAGNRVHLSIRDNGTGFDPSAKSKGGIGLLSMRERVRLVGGEFSLKSNRGKGTRIDVWAPLTKDVHEKNPPANGR